MTCSDCGPRISRGLIQAVEAVVPIVRVATRGFGGRAARYCLGPRRYRAAHRPQTRPPMLATLLLTTTLGVGRTEPGAPTSPTPATNGASNGDTSTPANGDNASAGFLKRFLREY